jgi:hypothetical protein
MRKLAFVFVAAFVLAVPAVATAQGFSVDVGDDGYRGRGDHREFRGGDEYRDHDRGRHHDWDRHHYRHGDRVIIKRHRDHRDWDD